MRIADALGRVLDEIEDAGVPHVVVGGLALDALGVPRATVDVDVQVAMDPPEPGAAVFLGLLIDERSRDPVFGQEVVIAHTATSGVPVEFFFATHWLPVRALARRELVQSGLLDRPIPVPIPADFILLKSAYACAPSRSRAKAAQDAVDMEAVAKAHRGKLDVDALESDARKLGTWSLLEAVLEDAGILPRSR